MPEPDAPEAPDAPIDAVFHRLIDSVEDYAIFMLDLQGCVRSWNKGAERLNGYKGSEIIGEHFSTFYTDADRQLGHPDQELATVRRDGRFFEAGRRVRKDGSMFWANVLITAVRDIDGKLLGYGNLMRDLTAAKEAEERLRQSEERLRLLIENVGDYAIFMLDCDGFIISWNSGAERLKGYTSAEIIGKHFSIFYGQEERDRHHPEEELAIVRRHGRYEEEGWRIRKDGTAFWANVVISAVHDKDGRLRGFAMVTRDLTEKYLSEAKGRLAEERASQEATRSYNARLAVQLRDEFIFIAAHELRTPLTALKLKLQGMERMLLHVSDVPERLQQLPNRLKGANQQVSRLADLVEKLLDVSRIVHGRLDLNWEAVDLVEVAQQVIDEFAESAQTAGVEIRLQTPHKLLGVWDPGRLGQIVTNLVSNAIKYGNGSPVDIIVREVGSNAFIAVKDRGIGIAAEYIDRIFDRFERAAAPANNYGGLGLGLYITRHLVEAHGGSIGAESEPGAGTTFTLCLPRVHTSSAHEAGHAARPAVEH